MIKRVFLFILVLVSIQLTTAFSNEEVVSSNSSNESSDIDVSNSMELKAVSPCKELFTSIDFGVNAPSFEVFEIAITGYANLIAEVEDLPEKSHIISIADYSLSANEKRLWVVDLSNKKLLFNEYVAHGMGTGDEYAFDFSNQPSSHQSSLGFYITGVIYSGKHEKSLKLHGMEQGFNDLAYERGIVMHGADYVSQDFITQNGRLGRSHGCPAVSQDIKDEIIDALAEGSIFFSYYPDNDYLNNSHLLTTEVELASLNWFAEESE